MSYVTPARSQDADALATEIERVSRLLHGRYESPNASFWKPWDEASPFVREKTLQLVGEVLTAASRLRAGEPSTEALHEALAEMDKAYDAEIFTTLSDAEVKELVEAMRNHTGIAAPSDRLHASWGRHLVAVIRRRAEEIAKAAAVEAPATVRTRCANCGDKIENNAGICDNRACGHFGIADKNAFAPVRGVPDAERPLPTMEERTTAALRRVAIILDGVRYIRADDGHDEASAT